jgi:hypothetical protein
LNISSWVLTPGELTAHDGTDPRRVIQMGIRPAQIHVMSEISGIAWTQAWAGRGTGCIGDVAVSFLGLVEFIQNKRASGRLKDLADIEALGRSEEPE